MGFKRCIFQFLGGSLAALILSASPSWAKELQDWSFDMDSSELTFSLSDQVLPDFFLLANPPRLVLDIPDTEIGNVNPYQVYGGAVQYIRVAQHTPDNVRVVIELDSAIVLSPDQADIQFDDRGDGQRHWHFRPLIADGGDAVMAAEAESLQRQSSVADVSLSAANLSLSSKPVAATPLPIDPYEAESLNGVVTVPPLADVVSVPSLDNPPPDDMKPEADALNSVATLTEVPDLPPMTVPDLEETNVDEPMIASSAPAPDLRQSSLPDLSARVADTSSDMPEGDQSVASTSLQSTDVPVAEDRLDVPSTTFGVDAVAAVVSEDVFDRVEPTGEVSTLGESNIAVPVSIGPTESALAPVEVTKNNSVTLETSGNSSMPQPIQQPAAERTIVQTELPAPLTFGQPLPEDR